MKGADALDFDANAPGDPDFGGTVLASLVGHLLAGCALLLAASAVIRLGPPLPPAAPLGGSGRVESVFGLDAPGGRQVGAALPAPTSPVRKPPPPGRNTSVSSKHFATAGPSSGAAGRTSASPAGDLSAGTVTSSLDGSGGVVGVSIGGLGQGDWYLAIVQQRIRRAWVEQQMGAGISQPIGITFTILADGSVTDIALSRSSGVAVQDLAASRAIYSAGTFPPLPARYGVDRYPIEAIFKPEP